MTAVEHTTLDIAHTNAMGLSEGRGDDVTILFAHFDSQMARVLRVDGSGVGVVLGTRKSIEALLLRCAPFLTVRERRLLDMEGIALHAVVLDRTELAWDGDIANQRDSMVNWEASRKIQREPIPEWRKRQLEEEARGEMQKGASPVAASPAARTPATAIPVTPPSRRAATASSPLDWMELAAWCAIA